MDDDCKRAKNKPRKPKRKNIQNNSQLHDAPQTEGDAPERENEEPIVDLAGLSSNRYTLRSHKTTHITSTGLHSVKVSKPKGSKEAFKWVTAKVLPALTTKAQHFCMTLDTFSSSYTHLSALKSLLDHIISGASLSNSTSLPLSSDDPQIIGQMLTQRIKKLKFDTHVTGYETLFTLMKLYLFVHE